MEVRQKHRKSLQRILAWLLLSCTLLVAVAGTAVPVSAAETDTDTQTYGKFKLSYQALTKGGAGSYYDNYFAEFSSNNRLFLFLRSSNENTGIRDYSVGVLLNNGICQVASFYNKPVDIWMHSVRYDTYKASDDSLFKQHDPISCLDPANNRYTAYLSFQIYSDDNFSCSTYVFDSLASAAAFFDTGDKSGIIKSPASSGDSDSDTENGWLQDLIDKLKEWEDGAFGALVGPFISFGEGLVDIRNAILNLLPEKIKDVISDLLSIRETLTRDTLGKVRDIYSLLTEKVKEILSFLKDIHDELKKFAVLLANAAWNLLPESVREFFQPFFDGVSGFLENLKTSVNLLGEKFVDFIPSFNDVKEFIRDIKNVVKNSRIGEYLSNIKESIESFPGLAATIQNFFEDPMGFLKKALELAPELSPFHLLLVPSEEYLAGLISDLHKDFPAIFSFIDEVDKIVKFLKTSTGAKAPSFTINLGKSASYYLGDTVTIDFSWYETYKPTVDLLFAAIIWAGFIWRMYSRIPEIISGTGMIVSAPYQIEHMEMEADHRDMVRSRADIRWHTWFSSQMNRRR